MFYPFMRAMSLVMIFVIPVTAIVSSIMVIGIAVERGGWHWLLAVFWIPFLIVVTGFGVDVLVQGRRVAKEKIRREER